jgi:hypothetical protein
MSETLLSCVPSRVLWPVLRQWGLVISSRDQWSKLLIISPIQLGHKTASPGQVYTLLSWNVNILTALSIIRPYRPLVCDRFVILKWQQLQYERNEIGECTFCKTQRASGVVEGILRHNREIMHKVAYKIANHVKYIHMSAAHSLV